jgi:hypothetical protein
MIPPGLNLIVAQPGPNRAGRNTLHQVLFDGYLRQLLARPALPGFAVLPRRTTGQRYDKGTLQGGERASCPCAQDILQAVRGLPPLAPALDRRHTTVQSLRDGGIRPLGMTERAQHNLSSLHDGETRASHTLSLVCGNGLAKNLCRHDEEGTAKNNDFFE